MDRLDRGSGSKMVATEGDRGEGSSEGVEKPGAGEWDRTTDLLITNSSLPQPEPTLEDLTKGKTEETEK